MLQTLIHVYETKAGSRQRRHIIYGFSVLETKRYYYSWVQSAVIRIHFGRAN